MKPADIYKSKLKTAEQAAAAIPSKSKMAMGMALAEPPALLKALADRARAGGVEALKLYYFEATSIAADTVLGALPNLVLAALKERNDLGVHSEALCPGVWTSRRAA